MNFETVIKARTPRTNCVECGVKTVAVPWAEKSFLRVSGQQNLSIQIE